MKTGMKTGMKVQLRLPATSANLGPGFDAMALALGLFLEIEAVARPTVLDSMPPGAIAISAPA